MPSLRVLPVGEPTVYGEILPTDFPGWGDAQFDILTPLPLPQAAELLRTGGIHLVLFAPEGAVGDAREEVKALLKAADQAVVLVLAQEQDAAAEAACLRCGAQDYLALRGLAAQELARAMALAWERHGFQRAAGETLATRHAESIQTANQLAARTKEVVEERIRAEKALVETVARYRFLLDSLPQIVWTADANGSLVYINRFWGQYSGRSIEQTLAEGWGESIHPEDAASTLERQRVAIEKGEPFGGIQHRLRAHDGTYRWHELRAVPRRNAAGKILEWIGAEADIDDQKRMAERLEEAHDALGVRILERTSELAHANALLQEEVQERRRAEAEALKAREIAEAANRSKTEFLANISHEIRTPMNGIIGMTDLALETELDLQQREYLQLVAHSADSLLILINDMLDFAKIEAGKLELENASFGLRKMLEETVKALRMRASQKGIGLNLEILPAVPARIVGDSNRLRQVLVNLLTNAIKFTEKGEVGVRVSVISSRNERINLLFEVSDTGIGIPEDKQRVIFEAFAQVDGSMTRRFGGTGLGLAIVSSLVEKMGGDIRVHSKLGEGSTFSFNWPASLDVSGETDGGQDDAGAEQVLLSLPPEPNREDAMRVMIVADQRSETGIALSEMLHSLGLESTVAGLGETALGEIERAQAQGCAYRLIMVDAALGDMGGERFVQTLAEHEEFKAPVVLMLSGSASPEEVKRAWAAGPDWVLYKPVIPADLMETLERSSLMVEPAHVRQLQAKPEPTASKKDAKPPLRVLIAEDNMVNQIVVERILISLGCDITTVANGREALEALDRKPFDLILMDIQMPEMDGMEATRGIRSLPDHRAHLPIVAMTAHAMKGDRERFLASGMDHYISKPFHKDELIMLIKSIESRVRNQGTGMEAETAIPEPRRSLLDSFLKAMGGEETLFQGACELFAELMPGRVEELRQALEECQAQTAERLAHNLRASLDSVGARETSERLAVLEANLRSRDFPGARTHFEHIQEDIREILAEIEARRAASPVAG